MVTNILTGLLVACLATAGGLSLGMLLLRACAPLC